MTIRQKTLTTIAYAILTFFLFLSFLGVVAVLAPFGWEAATGNSPSIFVEQFVHPSELSSLPDGVGPGAKRVPVTIKIAEPNRTQMLLEAARLSALFAIGIATLWVLRNIVSSLRTGDPFNRENVGRLRKLGLLLLIGWPTFEMFTTLINGWLADTTPVGSLGSGWEFPPAPEAMFTGLVVLILAEVFAHGLRLREDVEATI